MRKYAARQYAISASSFFSYSAFSDRFIGHMMLYIWDRKRFRYARGWFAPERRCAVCTFCCFWFFCLLASWSSCWSSINNRLRVKTNNKLWRFWWGAIYASHFGWYEFYIPSNFECSNGQLVAKTDLFKEEKERLLDVDERNLTTYGVHLILNHRDLTQWFFRLRCVFSPHTRGNGGCSFG